MSAGKGTAKRARGSSESARAAREKVGRLAKIAAVLGVVWFAVEGGEYGTFDLVRQSRAEARLRTEIDSLQRIVDSLTRYHRRLQTDVVLQERIAREEFGMVKGPNEVLYRFADPATPADSEPPAR